MLIFKTTPLHLDWAELNEQNQVINSGMVLPEHPFPKTLMQVVEEAEKCVYLIENGGPEFTQTVTELTPGMLNILQNLQKYAPYENTLLMNTIFQMVTMRPDLEHMLLCNTAFFQTMPQTARSYALPKALRYPEIQRYGSDGIFHQFGSQKIRTAYPQNSEKLITVFLDEFSASVAVIHRGIAVDCSSGFSKLEGIPGLTSVGSTDPILPLYLYEDGMSVDQSLQVLTTQSGFRALDPQLDHLDTLILNTMPEQHKQSREKLLNLLLKQIGGGLAILNGAQQVLLITPSSIDQTSHFLMEVAQELTPLGASCLISPVYLTNGLVKLTTEDSWINIHALHLSPWTVLADAATVGLME